MIVGAGRAGLLRFSLQRSLGFTEDGQRKRKYPVSSSCVDENALLTSEVRGEQADWFQSSVSEHTRRSTLKQMGYRSRTTHQLLLSAKNRKLRLQFTYTHQTWTIEDWKNVSQSEESQFQLFHSDGRVRI